MAGFYCCPMLPRHPDCSVARRQTPGVNPNKIIFKFERDWPLFLPPKKTKTKDNALTLGTVFHGKRT